jgi:hypothetical protein
MPAPLTAVLGGKIEFAEKAFPLVADQKEVAVQTALRKAAPAPCAACRGTGKVPRTGVCKAPPGVLGRPIAKTWEEDCPTCGGYKDVYDARFAQRLAELADALGHIPREGSFATLLKSAEDRLAAALQVREKTVTTSRCKPVISETQRMKTSSVTGQEYLDTTRTMTGVDLVPGPSIPYRLDVPAMVAPLWARTGMSAPTAQGVFLIGTLGDRAEVAGWIVVRLEPAKGAAAILLFSASEGRAPSAGKVAVGGLLVGRWTPDGGGSETPATPAPKTAAVPKAPGATAPKTGLPPDPKTAGAPAPAAPKTTGAPPRASFGPNPALPVVLVVAAAAASGGR